MKTQTTIMVLGVIAAASLISVAGFSENMTQYAVVSTAEQSLQMVGHLELIAMSSDGNIKQYIQTDNFIQTQGANCIVNALFGGVATGQADCVGDSGSFDVIQIGTGTPINLDATTITAAVNIGTNPVAASSVIIEDSTVAIHTTGFGANATVTANFVATAGGDTITEALLTNSTGAPIAVMAYKNFGDIVLAEDDSLTVAWTVSVLEA